MIDLLKIVSIIGLSSSAYSSKNHSGSPSNPLAVVVSRFNARYTSAVVVGGLLDPLVVFGVKL